jgi:DNA (cytosine-5)-methyltransferase 1
LRIETFKSLNPAKNTSTSTIARQIGNVVPVELGAIIAKSIEKHLEIYE